MKVKKYSYGELRSMLGLTQEKFAEKIKIHRVTYNNIETYKSLPKLTTLERITKAIKPLNLELENIKVFKTDL